MNRLAKRGLDDIRRLEMIRPGDRVGVAVSGGVDSVALLRLLLELRHELGIVLSVVHFNHKLRGAESERDQEFVRSLAREHGLEFFCESGNVAQVAAEEHFGLEAAARGLRHRFFGRLLGANENSAEENRAAVPQGLKSEALVQIDGTVDSEPLYSIPAVRAAPVSNEAREPAFENPASVHELDKVATGHTLDDQAETVLMRIIRGTGSRGLGGIYPRIAVEHEGGEGSGEIVRPLLEVRRWELEKYLTDIKQTWREDSTNADSKFTRNRVRKLVMPLLEREFNPTVVENLSELSEIARDEEDYWDSEISGWMGTAVQWALPEWNLKTTGNNDGGQALVQIRFPHYQPAENDLTEHLGPSAPELLNASVSRPWLLTEPKAVQRRVLKAIGEQAGIPLEFKHIEEILRFAGEHGPGHNCFSLPLGWTLVREPAAIVFVRPNSTRQGRILNYEYLLPLPGQRFIPELGLTVEAVYIAAESAVAEYNPQQLLRADLLADPLTVRNWRPGDRFWPAHTKSPKKVKELLQGRHVRLEFSHHPGLRFAQTQRKLWPVAAQGNEILWMRGFPVSARLLAEPGQEAILIREIPSASGSANKTQT